MTAFAIASNALLPRKSAITVRKSSLRFCRQRSIPPSHCASERRRAIVHASANDTDSPWKAVVSTAARALVAAGACAILAGTNVVHAASLNMPSMQSNPLRISGDINDSEVMRFPAHWEIHSENSAQETFLLFANQTDGALDVLWVNYEGKEVQYATIQPGRMHLQPSYATHPWVVREHTSQNSVLFLMADADPKLAVIGDLPGDLQDVASDSSITTETLLGQIVKDSRTQ